MSSWRLARSLDVLRAEVRAAHPGSRVDTIGDDAHSTSWSDHNPNAAGVVCAADFFANAGLNLDKFALAVVSARHPALKYVIYNRRVWSTAYADAGWRTYTGSNPHTTHVHVSVGTGPDGRSAGPFDSPAPWGIAAAAGTEEELVETIKIAQQALKDLGHDPGAIDGRPGPKTLTALSRFFAHATNSFQWTRNGVQGLTLYSYAWDGTVAATQARTAAEQARDEVRQLADRAAQQPVELDYDRLAAAMVRELVRLAADPGAA